MGLLESVIGNLLGGGSNQQQQNSPLGGMLGQILGGAGGAGGANSPLAGVLGGLLGGQQASNQGGIAGNIAGALAGMGGIGGLLQQFQQAGLGHIADSWVGNGANLPVSPGQLGQVFGQARTDTMAQHAGMSSGDLLSQLSHLLPHAVDQMTPNGVAPAPGASPFDGAGQNL